MSGPCNHCVLTLVDSRGLGKNLRSWHDLLFHPFLSKGYGCFNASSVNKISLKTPIPIAIHSISFSALTKHTLLSPDNLPHFRVNDAIPKSTNLSNASPSLPRQRSLRFPHSHNRAPSNLSRLITWLLSHRHSLHSLLPESPPLFTKPRLSLPQFALDLPPKSASHILAINEHDPTAMDKPLSSSWDSDLELRTFYWFLLQCINDDIDSVSRYRRGKYVGSFEGSAESIEVYPFLWNANRWGAVWSNVFG